MRRRKEEVWRRLSVPLAGLDLFFSLGMWLRVGIKRGFFNASFEYKNSFYCKFGISKDCMCTICMIFYIKCGLKFIDKSVRLSL